MLYTYRAFHTAAQRLIFSIEGSFNACAIWLMLQAATENLLAAKTFPYKIVRFLYYQIILLVLDVV